MMLVVMTWVRLLLCVKVRVGDLSLTCECMMLMLVWLLRCGASISACTLCLRQPRVSRSSAADPLVPTVEQQKQSPVTVRLQWGYC